jgi:VCBS repeat-containing protein
MFRPRLLRWLPRALRTDRTCPARRGPSLAVTQLEDRTTPATFTVTNLTDSGPGSLRAAIGSANATPGADTIVFTVAGTINTATPLALTDTTGGTTIDGFSAPGYSGAPVVEVKGTGGSGSVRGIDVRSPNNAIMGLQVTSFSTLGIYIVGTASGNFGVGGTAANTLVAGNYLGTDGTAAAGGFYGLVIDGSANNRIGIVDGIGARNVISGNKSEGIRVMGNGSAGNVIAGNYIGTNAAGTAAVPNTSHGVILLASNNFVGTDGNGVSDAAERNVISGNNGAGVSVSGNTNVIAGNYIGPNAGGTAAIGNATFNDGFTAGVYLGGSGNRIGTNGDGMADADEGNVISGNRFRGVMVNAGSNNVLAGNYIGTNAAGTAAVPNVAGVLLLSGTNTRIGTDGNGVGDASERNVISGNTDTGIVFISASVIGTAIAGNYIGLNAAGTAAVPNTNMGVSVGLASNTRVGTDGNGVGDVDERNIISGNIGAGVNVSSVPTVVAGNYIGTNAAGTAAVPNTRAGVSLSGTVRVGSNLDGVNDAAEGNLISGNGEDGVQVFGGGAVVAGNSIGLSSGGTALGNTLSGVAAQFGASANTIRRNTIAYNVREGVLVLGTSSANNRITENAIHSNGRLGINLSNSSTNDGVTANDIGDGDTGANGLQNFPVLTAASSGGGTTTVVGTLNSTVNTTFTVEFFASTAADPSGFGEGQRYLGSASVMTNASGNVSFTVTLPVAAAPNEFVSATATNLSGATSEFSGGNVQVPAPNSAPTAANDSYAANEDATLTVAAPGVLGNDADADGNPLTAQIVSGPTNGSLTLNMNGSFTYTPAANFYGTDSFTYRAHDGTTTGNVATVTLAVNAVNDAPGFTKGADQSVAEDAGPQSAAGWATAISAGPANESGQAAQFLITVSNPGLFSVLPAVSPTGTLTYTPASNANGAATVTVLLADNGGTANGGQDTSAAQTFTISVTAVNDAPIARSDTATTDEDTAVNVLVLANDSTGPATATDEAGQTLSIFSITQPAHGTAAIHDNGTPGNPADDYVVYIPNPNYNGADSFTYTIRDSGAPPEEATSTGTITINPVNDSPTVANATLPTAEDTAVTVDLRPLASDVETADANLTFTIVTGPGSGTLAATGTPGVYTYTPAGNFNGMVTFTYTVTDTGDPTGSTNILTSNTATVTITVSPVNDAPVSVGDAYSTNEDTALAVAAPGVLGNDSDVDGDLLQAVLVTGPANGTLTLNPDGSFLYTPAANFHGSDSFKYKANDGTADSNTVTVSLTVNSVNDAPVAADDTATTNEDTAVAIVVLLNDSDVDGDALAVTAVSPGANGTVTFTASGVTYTPAANYFGSDTFTYTVSDGNGGTATATVTVMILPVNDAPAAAADAVTTAEDTPATIAVLANDSDIDGDPLAVTAVTQGSNGNVVVNGNGTVTYTPAANFHGTDSFTYTVSDGNGGTATATVAVTVTSVNDAPVAADDTATTNEDTAVAIAVLLNDSDVDGDALAVTAVSPGANGAVTFTASGVSYTPAVNFHGIDSFTYTVSDGNGGTATATVTITVTSVNDAPVAAAQSVTTNEDTAVSGTVVANDVDGNTLTYVVAVGPAQGTLSLNATTGSFTYTPSANYNGPDSFTFKANDGTADSNIATVAITVTAVNDAPVSVGETYSTNEDTPLTVAAPGVLGNDTDVEGSALTAILVSGPSHGTLTFNADGSFVYSPAANFNGTDSFTYKANDGTADSNTVTVSLTVNSVNDAPVATGNMYTATAGTTLTVAAPGVLVNDSDVDGNVLSALLVSGPAHGTLTLNANGSFTYTANASFSGTDTFTYKANDGTADSNIATVTITVNPGGAGATIVVDPCDPSKTALVVRGTTGNDTITITPSNNSGAVTVKLNGTTLGTFNPTGRVIVFGLEGNDDLQTAGSVSLPVWLHGGAGNDRLKGGDGHDVLLGEDGDDLLVGGGGRDLLIGGEGADRLVGNADDDILIAGFTDHDDDHALCAIMNEWTSTRDFATRVNNLIGGPGAGANRANGNTFLNADTTHDDGREDVLTGSSGIDWFLFNVDGDGGVRDRVTDMSTFESMFATDIDFIYVDPV